MSKESLRNTSREDDFNASEQVSAANFVDPVEISDLNTETEQMQLAEKLHDILFMNKQVPLMTQEDELNFQFDTTLIYLEAGSTKDLGIDEVANERLAQYAETAEEQGFIELAAQINLKIDEING